MPIKRNLHTLDRLTRIVIGVTCTYFGFVDHSIITNTTISILIGLFGVINIAAAITSHCPVYGISGISTYKDENKTNTQQ